MDLVAWSICVWDAFICSGMSVLLFRSRPYTSSSSSAPASAPVFILSWLRFWRCQHIWNTFATAYFGVSHHRRVGKKRKERRIRVDIISASYSMFNFCAETVSRMRFFLWFSLVSPCKKITPQIDQKTTFHIEDAGFVGCGIVVSRRWLPTFWRVVSSLSWRVQGIWKMNFS